MRRTTYRFVKLGLLSMPYSSDLPIQRRMKPNEIKNGDKTVVYTKDDTVPVCKFCPEQHKQTCLCNKFVQSHDAVLHVRN